MVPINEYVDTLINARRYDIMNEGLFFVSKKELDHCIRSIKSFNNFLNKSGYFSYNDGESFDKFFMARYFNITEIEMKRAFKYCINEDPRSVTIERFIRNNSGYEDGFEKQKAKIAFEKLNIDKSDKILILSDDIEADTFYSYSKDKIYWYNHKNNTISESSISNITINNYRPYSDKCMKKAINNLGVKNIRDKIADSKK